MKWRSFLICLVGAVFCLTGCANTAEVSGVSASKTLELDSESSITEIFEGSNASVDIDDPESSVEVLENEVEDGEQSDPKEGESVLKIQVGETIFTASLAENSTVNALKELLSDGPLTLSMSDYAGMEKGADLGTVLPENNQQMNTKPGDIILYQGRTFVIYYDTNSWSLTPIGTIDSVDPDVLREVLGSGDVEVTISLE